MLPGNSPLGFPFFDFLALVVPLLAPGDSDFYFYFVSFGINGKRHNRLAAVLARAGEFGDLFFGQKKAAIAARVVVARSIARLVGRNVHSQDKSLAITDNDMRTFKLAATQTKRLDLEPEQFDTSLELFENFVIVMDFFVNQKLGHNYIVANLQYPGYGASISAERRFLC